MRYRIIFSPPNNDWECVIHKTVEEREPTPQTPDPKKTEMLRKANAIWSVGLDVQKELFQAGSFKLVRIEEVLED